MKSNLAKFISYLLRIIFLGGIILLPFMPKIYDIFILENMQTFAQQNIFYKLAFYLAYLVALAIIFVLVIIFKHVYLEPFTNLIVKSLKIIAVLFMVLFVIVLGKSLVLPSLISYLISLIAFIASLSFYVLSQVYKVAIQYKKEIDYTV